ncbi:MAG: DUF4271 domain-containing protein [Muribaculaceae bacterium]|nr:DUF4271 domain-containing protein [Muribaculaceae bacterium]
MPDIIFTPDTIPDWLPVQDTDSLAAETPVRTGPYVPDGVLVMPRYALPHPFDADLDHALASMVRIDKLDMSEFNKVVATADAPPAWTHGYTPQPRMINPAGHSIVLGLLATLFVASLLAYSYFGRALGYFVSDLWRLRRRENAFDDSATGRRTVQVLLALQLAAYSGVLLYAWCRPGPVADVQLSLANTLRLMGLAAAYYVVQLCAYSTVAYAFAPDRLAGLQWLNGFNASQGLAGLLLALPTLGIVFYPDATDVMLWVALGIYLAARVMFIIKGFKIFYTGFGSLIYFILYLCTLEIVPFFCVAAITLLIVG